MYKLLYLRMPKTGSTTLLNGRFGWCTLNETVLHEETGESAGMAKGSGANALSACMFALLGT